MLEKTINCPVCSTLIFRQKLRKLKHPKGIMLDVCDNCKGMWVDGSELEVISGLEKVRKDGKRKK